VELLDDLTLTRHRRDKTPPWRRTSRSADRHDNSGRQRQRLADRQQRRRHLDGGEANDIINGNNGNDVGVTVIHRLEAGNVHEEREGAGPTTRWRTTATGKTRLRFGPLEGAGQSSRVSTRIPAGGQDRLDVRRPWHHGGQTRVRAMITRSPPSILTVDTLVSFIRDDGHGPLLGVCRDNVESADFILDAVGIRADHSCRCGTRTLQFKERIPVQDAWGQGTPRPPARMRPVVMANDSTVSGNTTGSSRRWSALRLCMAF